MFNNLTNFSKIAPFKADQGMKPYFYVKSTVDKKQYSSNGNVKKVNEVSIYDMINNKESKTKNGNAGQSKAESDRQESFERTSGFVRKKINPEMLEKENSMKNSVNYVKNSCKSDSNKGMKKPNYYHSFMKIYENLSNFHIMLRSVTPLIEMKSEIIVKFLFKEG